MPLISYISKKFAKASLEIIGEANRIIEELAVKGYDLTLRQLYYRFIAEDAFPESWRDPQSGSKNVQRNYKNLGVIVNDARLAGLVDWERIVDRTRELRRKAHWDSPEEIVRACANQYSVDRWKYQRHRPEVWIEKDALVGVIEPTCRSLDVPCFSCRGYTSQSEMWRASQRVLSCIEDDQAHVIFHMGDHDPSGIDMTRDVRDRLDMFTGGKSEVRRIALNMDQVNEYGPPPSPAKITDSRAEGYIAEFGNDSWELDALEPSALNDLIEEHVLSIRNEDQWRKAKELEGLGMKRLDEAAKRLESKGQAE